MSEITREVAMKLTSEAKGQNEIQNKLKLKDAIEDAINHAIKAGFYSCSFYTFSPLLDILEYKKIYEAKGFDFYIKQDSLPYIIDTYKITIYWDCNREKQKLKYHIYECDCGYKYASISRLHVTHCNKRIKGIKLYA